MTKRILSVLFLAVMLLCLLAGCNDNDVISPEKAQKIVLDDLGVSANEVDLHLHVGEYEGSACYSIYVTIDGENLEYLIGGTTGEILAINKSNHSH